MANQEITPTQRSIAVCTEIEQERLRQINQLGYDSGYDDFHYADKPDLLRVALIYASQTTHPEEANKRVPIGWPWDARFWKPGLPRRMLIKAAALIVAHIEVLDRRAEREAAQVEDDAGAVDAEG